MKPILVWPLICKPAVSATKLSFRQPLLMCKGEGKISGITSIMPFTKLWIVLRIFQAVKTVLIGKTLAVRKWIRQSQTPLVLSKIRILRIYVWTRSLSMRLCRFNWMAQTILCNVEFKSYYTRRQGIYSIHYKLFSQQSWFTYILTELSIV